MATNQYEELDEFRPEEQELIGRIKRATQRELPVHLAQRIELQIQNYQPGPKPLAAVRWAAMAAIFVLVASALGIWFTLSGGTVNVTAAEVEKRVEQASQKYWLPGYIRYREYDTTDNTEVIRPDGQVVKISFPVDYKDWSLIGESGILTKVKSTESGSYETESYSQVTLYDSTTGLQHIYVVPPSKIIEIKTPEVKYSVNELETKDQMLKNPNQPIYAGTIQYKQASLTEQDKDHYLLVYEFEAAQKVEDKEVKSKGGFDFLIDKKNFEVIGYTYRLSFTDPEGVKVNYNRQAKIRVSQFLAPDPARSEEIFRLGAPEGTPIERS